MKRLRTNDVAGLLGESEYAVRALASQYVLYIPATRIGDERFFSPEAVDVFRLIFEQMAVGVRDEYIELMLGKRYPVAEVAVAGIPGASAFHPTRLGTLNHAAAYPAEAGPDDGRTAQPFASASDMRYHETFLAAAPARMSPAMSVPVETRREPAVAPADSDANRAARETLLLQAQLLQQRVDALEQRVREIESSEASTAGTHRALDDATRPMAEMRTNSIVAPRRGFDDLAGRKPVAGG